MAHFSTTLDTKASVETAFAYLAEFSNTAEWDPTVSRARNLTPGPIREGTLFDVVLSLGGREIPFVYRITRFEPHRRLVLESTTPHLRSIDTIEIEPLPDGCRVHYDADLRPLGVAYLFDLPLHLLFQLSGARSARGLAAALASRG
jgi:hypothetical protein